MISESFFEQKNEAISLSLSPPLKLKEDFAVLKFEIEERAGRTSEVGG